MKRVDAVAPLRVPLAGGGTDLPEWYKVRGAHLLSAAIDRRLRLQVELGPQSPTQALDPLARHFLSLHPGWGLATTCDVPPRVGLGGSGCLAVCLVAAHAAIERLDLTPQQIGWEAYRWEREIIGSPVGFQDQIAAAVGGAVIMSASPGGEVTAAQDRPLCDALNDLFATSLVVAQTPLRHRASTHLVTLARSFGQPSSAKTFQPATVEAMRAAILARDGVAVGQLLRAHWEAKRANSPDMTNPTIDAAMDAALSAGAVGGKLMGAGGGGFLLLSGSPAVRSRIIAAVEEAGCIHHEIRCQSQGVQVMEHEGKTR